jgi:Flp pilus assembly protein CpaB
MTYRLRNIVLAVVLAVLAAFLTAMYVANYQSRVDRGQEKVKVFVAKVDIAPGTPAAAIAKKVSEQEVVRKNVVPVAVTDLDEVAGQSTSQWVYSGEQLSARRFVDAGQGGIRTELKGNLRALELPGTPHQLLNGVLKAGDHVDVVSNIQVSQDINVSRILLRDIKVLRAPQADGASSKIAGATDAFAVTLLLTDSQAHKLFFVTAGNEKHEWWLELRPPADATDSPESRTTLKSVLTDGLPRNQLGGN